MTPTTDVIPVSTDAMRRRPGIGTWGLMMPLAAWLAIFVAAPLVILFIYSFCQHDELGQVLPRFTSANYQRALDWTYLRILFSSLLYAGITTILCVVIGYPVAYYIGRAPEIWRNRLLMAVMIPFWTSFLIRTYAWMIILAEEGPLNGLLKASGIIPHLLPGPLDLMYTPFAVVLGLVYMYLPFMILPIYSSVEKLDGSLIEAALDLGASPLSAFRRVILPLTWPGIVAGTMLVFIPAIGMFAVTDLMGGGRVVMVGNLIQNQFQGQGRDQPFGSALGISLMALFVLTFAWRKSQRRSGVAT
jgi:spermidine/putrescine transport system permease protein